MCTYLSEIHRYIDRSNRSLLCSAVQCSAVEREELGGKFANINPAGLELRGKERKTERKELLLTHLPAKGT